MQHFSRTASMIVIAGSIFLARPVVGGGGGVSISLKNDSTENIRVTVYDRNARPSQSVLAAQAINGFAAVSISVMPDESGQGHLAWTATTADPARRMCGQGETMVNEGDTVNVAAEAECAAR
jgi:hypothetical protein